MPNRRRGFSNEIGRQEERKLRTLQRLHEPLWLGFSVMGVIGWGIVVPSLAGLALGAWLDSTHPGKHSWTLSLFALGLLIGCFNAGYWVNSEMNAIRRDQEQPPSDQKKDTP
ncbi:MAG: AtpZ/AtpI family protein [Limisphaerales bacterium]